MATMKLKNRVVVVTGSSTGIGAGIAKHLGKLGYATCVTYQSNKAKANQVAKSINNAGGEALALQLDVTSEKSVMSFFNHIAKKFGQLDVLVNNAAVDWPTPIESCTFDDWKTITRTKIDGNFLCTKYALPLLEKTDNPHVIIIMSNLGDRPDPEDPAYSVGTAGTIAFMKAMALALAKYGIRVNAVGPGETKTASKYWQVLGNTKKMWVKLAKENPLGRVTTTEDVALTIRSIIEDKTKYWNGNIIYVNGGGHLK